MEKMPYQDAVATRAKSQSANPFEWHFGLPTLQAANVTLRELRHSDAASLMAMLSSDEVAEFISPLPRTVEGFRNFISDIHEERLAGHSFCFGIVPEGYEDAMGLFQVRRLEPGFASA